MGINYGIFLIYGYCRILIINHSSSPVSRPVEERVPVNTTDRDQNSRLERNPKP